MHACRHESSVLLPLALQHHLRSMPLTVGETPICLSAQRGKGCTIQDAQAVTQDNFCPGSSGAEAAPGSSSNQAGSSFGSSSNSAGSSSGSSSNQAGSSSGSSSNQAGSSPDRGTRADDDYGDYNELDGYADDDDDEDVSNDDYYGNNDDQLDDDLHGDQQQQGNDDNAEDNGDNDDTNKVNDEQEGSDSKLAVCNRLQDFQSLVDHAQFEWQKEQIEGHIRSNSLVFNTFIFLQVTAHVVFA